MTVALRSRRPSLRWRIRRTVCRFRFAMRAKSSWFQPRSCTRRAIFGDKLSDGGAIARILPERTHPRQRMPFRDSGDLGKTVARFNPDGSLRSKPMEFRNGSIDGVIWTPLKKYHDARGWLCELFREDDVPEQYVPVMAYISETQPGITRGPHEQVEQADYFCFIGPGNFKVYLWDNRPAAATYQVKETRVVGADAPFALIVPPGVVHAYKNVSAGTGLVV